LDEAAVQSIYLIGDQIRLGQQKMQIRQQSESEGSDEGNFWEAFRQLFLSDSPGRSFVSERG
jgi:hypothetical protein